MCGITGCYSFKDSGIPIPGQLKNAVEQLFHRGPDSKGTYQDERIVLGHTRLSIIDLSETGHQPMKSQNGESVIVYNGECYNYRELKTILGQQGHAFQSDSDTEVLLKLLEIEGIEGLQKVNGFFSFAFYNRQTGNLLLGRDRFGIKPLYYYQDDDRLIFSSEVKGILSFQPKLTLNKTGLNAYLHLNYIPSPYTIYNEIRKVMPGNYLLVKQDGSIETASYYEIEKTERKPLHADPVENFKIKMEQSVNRRMIADVPVGCFLSGGLDSSVIAGIASKTDPKLKTFTLVFKDNQTYDESHYAALVAKKFNTDHHELAISTKDLLDSVPEIFGNTDDPFADSSTIALYNLCKAAKPHIKVALSGDGGDELLAGYYKHKAFQLSFAFPTFNKLAGASFPLLRKLPQSRTNPYLNYLRKVARYGAAAALRPNERYWFWAGFNNVDYPLLLPEMTLPQSVIQSIMMQGDINNLNDVLLQDLKMVLEGDMLVKTDRMSMANGLEVRVPFLDHELVETARLLPIQYKLSNGKSKVILRKAFGNMLPAEILQKKKHGFEVPLRSWLRNELNDLMSELLDEQLIEEQGIFDPSTIALVQQNLQRSNSANCEQVLWNLMVFNAWWIKHRNDITA